MKELIIKYISGETNHKERELVEAWAAENRDNKKELEEMEKIWRIGGDYQQIPEIDVDKAWVDFVHMRNRSRRNRPMWIGIAASLLLFSALAFWGARTLFSEELNLKSDLHVQHVELPDGSMVHLNTHAEMVYQKQWLSKERKVRLLKGEVFFDVKKDSKSPFVIESGKSKVTVLGTSFQVNRNGTDTEIIVASGAVKVNYSKQEIVLKPQQLVVIPDTSNQKVRVDTVSDQLYRYYVHQEFTFENTPLSRAFEVLGKAYGKVFIIEDPKIKALTYTATFEQQGLNEILDVILKTFDLTISKKEDVYYIN